MPFQWYRGLSAAVIHPTHVLSRKATEIRPYLAFSHDLLASVVAWYGAYWLRFNLETPQPWVTAATETLPWVLVVHSFVFAALGLYRGIWRYASLPDLRRILFAVALATLGVLAVLVMLRLTGRVPRSVFVLSPILLAGFMCGSRLAYRAWKEYRLYQPYKYLGKPVLVVGAGTAAAALVKELDRSEEWRVVGLVDDDSAKLGRVLHSAKVLGTIEDVPVLAKMHSVERAIIAMPSASPHARRRAMEACAEVGVQVFTVPQFDDLVSGRVTVSQIRKVQVEDLLGREPVVLDNAGLNELLANRTVLVTGAGGSIGAELCRQIAHFKPGLLVLLEQSEYALYQIEQELGSTYPELSVLPIIADVKNRARVEQIFRQYRPSVVFHAAAYKHVPLMEEENAWEAIRNNVWGTHVLAQCAAAAEVQKFVLISTDKAVNPVNVMGASKRLAEMVCQAAQEGADTRFVMVRFGNVLGSTGSVIPKFQQQIAAGGPVTVTHPEVIRYFMSIPEAAQLVLQAGLMGLGGEVFVLDMGEPIRITDLARDMIRLSGHSEEEIRIVYTGLRPGEKLFEELLADDEQTLPTLHPKLRIARAKGTDKEWIHDLVAWLKQDRLLSHAEVKRDLRRWVSEYHSAERPDLKAVRLPASQQTAE